nr:probable protein S-acyltransferase 23 [Tanacetum cinerariifolium]
MVYTGEDYVECVDPGARYISSGEGMVWHDKSRRSIERTESPPITCSGCYDSEELMFLCGTRGKLVGGFMSNSNVVALFFSKVCCKGTVSHDGNQGKQDNKGCTPLHWEALRGHVEACVVLLHTGTKDELMVKDTAGFTPAQIVADRGHHHISLILFLERQR